MSMSIVHHVINCEVIIPMNLLRVVLPDEVVKCSEHRWNEGLNVHVVLRWIVEDPKVLLKDPKDPFNNIVS